MTITITMEQLHKYVQDHFERKLSNPKNIVDALFLTAYLRKLAGLAIYEHYVDERSEVKSKLTLLGLFCTLIWSSAFAYCTYIATSQDQTIIRRLVASKLKHYGDLFEIYVSVAYAVYVLWKMAFRDSKNTSHIQVIVDIDNEIKELNKTIDYSRSSTLALIIYVAHIVTALVRLLSLWVSQVSLDTQRPVELMWQIVYSDALALVMTVNYCFYLILMKERYALVNEALTGIQNYALSKSSKTAQLQETYICSSVKTCARLYSMMYRGTKTSNHVFGLGLAITTLVCIIYIIVNLFYFMEANANAMFEIDMSRFVYFTIYISWEILYSIAILFLNVHFCESTVKVGNAAPHITHSLINSNISPAVNQVAMQLSLQLLHEQPSFSAGGLFKIKYVLLLKVVRFVAFFLTMLLQYMLDHKILP